MSKRVISCGVLIACMFSFLFSCKPAGKIESISSSITRPEQIVVGSANEGGYPNYDSSITFSDVSADLTSITPSSSDKEIDDSSTENSSKNSSKQTTTTSSKTQTETTTTSSAQSGGQTISGSKLNYKTVKAVWISYIDFASILTGKTEKQFKTNFEKVCKNCVDFGINTLVCQIRVSADAFYPSEYFAWSKNVSGSIGKAASFNPLEIMIDIAHKYKLSFHAWINPFRAYLNTEVSAVPSTSQFKKWYNDSTKKGNYIILYQNRWYFNPGEPEVRRLVINGVKEIINNYDVDGIHFDDYFYPSTAADFDKNTYSKYGAGKKLANWRRENVSTLVKDAYDAIKSKNSKIVFGISPQANIDNNLNYQYADVNLWCSKNGYVDYICPQIYYSYKSETLNFKDALAAWQKLVTASNVSLMVGIANYRIGYKEDTFACSDRDNHTQSTHPNCGKYGWITTNPSKSDILARQYTDSMKISKCSGVFLYRYDAVFNIETFFKTSEYVSNAVEQAKTEMQNLKEVYKK